MKKYQTTNYIEEQRQPYSKVKYRRYRNKLPDYLILNSMSDITNVIISENGEHNVRE